MKKFYTLFLLLATGIYAKSQSPELLKIMTFEGLENQVKADYGSKANPILSGAFININDQTKMLKLKNSYRWPDGQLIDFTKRFSTHSEDGKGIVDCYTLIKPGTADTIKLFVDPYKVSPVYYVPKGLTALTLPLLGKELAPYLTLAEELESSKDAFILKDQAVKLLGYIGSAIGIAPFSDQDILKSLTTDKEIDPGLRSFLFRAYIFNKFYAYGKNIPNEKMYAFDKVKLNFQKFIVAHPEVKTGGLNEWLK